MLDPHEQTTGLSLSIPVHIACACQSPNYAHAALKSRELSIHSFEDGDTPPYVIRSHTWGADEEEVTFADLESGDGKTKLGYEEILSCARQARHDGLEHFWVDTCCIDKTDKAEFLRRSELCFAGIKTPRIATRTYQTCQQRSNGPVPDLLRTFGRVNLG